MLRKTLLATALVVSSIAIPGLMPQKADAQVFVRGRVGVSVGTPYYGGYRPYYYGNYRPYYYSSYPSYGYSYGPRYYAPRSYGRVWW